MNPFFVIGNNVLSILKVLENFGKFVIFCSSILVLFFKKPRFKEILRHISIIGVGTIGVIFLTAFFTGMVESIQLYKGFHQFGVEGFMGYTIFISITKELGPVFGSLMVISRAISAMAAELGTMRVTEQIDAIETLALDSKELLIIPRIIATTISLPILVIFFDFIGNLSAFLISTNVLGINPSTYQSIIQQNLEFVDVSTGIIKAFIFGFLISLIGTYVGFSTSGGAKGVGIATTKAVVYAAVTVFAANYILSSIFLFLDW
jgi:phospholipid/cholesterol/gamma-HCH transport system permease protein